MERNNRVAAAVRRALIMGAVTAAGVAAPALAQENLGEIVVTGSRIKSANLESTTPVTQVTAADVVTQGVTRIEDLVNQLPQAFAAQNVTVANGATGTATLNLRGLGSARTLVLIDGRRMPYGGVTNSAADINQIPTQMVERVDILTGGASAVYGSDAVAGVVNFIMKKDFEGVEITSQYNFYWHENDFGGPGRHASCATSSRPRRRPTRRSTPCRMTPSRTAKARKSRSWSASTAATVAATSRPMPRCSTATRSCSPSATTRPARWARTRPCPSPAAVRDTSAGGRFTNFNAAGYPGVQPDG